MKPTYGALWDRYVAESFPQVQRQSERVLAYPGAEWGAEAGWAAIFEHLFGASQVQTWKHAVEIGGGAGKYTERVLAANDEVEVFGFDVSRNFLDATAERLSPYVDAGRLHLHEIDAARPDATLELLAARGLTRRIDAWFSIDAMVHVDLQYLVAYWITAALTLRPGGRMLMTLADPTAAGGFQKIRRDILKYYRFEGRMCPKFEYLSEEIVRAVLDQLGFDIVSLKQWSYAPGGAARDLYLIAELARPEQADRFRDALRAAPDAEASNEQVATYSELWDAALEEIAAGGSAPRPPAREVLAALAPPDASAWRRVVELGAGDTATTETLLGLNSEIEVATVAWGQRATAIYQALARRSDPPRLHARRMEPERPQGLFEICRDLRWRRQVDAVVSLNTLVHIDLQVMFAHLINAALVLKKGGVLVINVGDATTEGGLDALFKGIGRYFPLQGAVCPRDEFQSPSIMRHLLQALGFETAVLSHWAPTGATPRDLYVGAVLERPEVAEGFRADIGLTPAAAGGARPAAAKAGPQAGGSGRGADDGAIARLIGQVVCRHLIVQAQPEITQEDLKARMQEQWRAPDAYIRIGKGVLRKLAVSGYAVRRSEDRSPVAAKAKGG